MSENKPKTRNPWFWIPSLYYAQGIPYIVVMTVSVIMYKRLGISNTDIALYTSWLYLPWVLKPLWSPIVDIFGKKRNWIVIMQLLVGGGLAGVALTIPTSNFFQYTLAFFWLLAFNSSTHDIAADGFYMLGLSKHDQAWFVGIRNTFYRLSMITGQGLLVIVAGYLETETGDIPYSWMVTFFILTGLFILFFIYHKFILPYPVADVSARKDKSNSVFGEFLKTFKAFFKKKNIGVILGFILLYRLGESQLVKLASPFLLDTRDIGGLGLSTTELGIVYGTVGIICLTIGGIIGGFVVAKNGLKFWIWPMIIAINLPDLVYVYLAYSQTTNFIIINLMVAIEQFGYGFGFTAYMLYLIYIADGEYKTSHYAIATGFMALGMMIPGMWSGWLQELIGYQHFFVWVCISTIPGFIITKFLKIDPEFGKKTEESETK
ncbi:MAG TPA: MFS transporter [Ignavibacteriaceae bacterium]|nr:MFS transporter [Ignavibacteriaceae bacterium]HRQ53088.1 MFS transporter [Ignavibacteriaceae bacterium]